MSTRKPSEFVDHPVGYAYARDHGFFRAHCKHVTDGDTGDFYVDLGMGKYAYETIRLHDFDTAEIFSPKSPAERKHGLEAKARVESLLLDKPCLIRTFRDAETFGRYVADVYFLVTTENAFTEVSLAETLGREGFEKKESY